jgi:hypothetical protein
MRNGHAHRRGTTNHNFQSGIQLALLGSRSKTGDSGTTKAEPPVLDFMKGFMIFRAFKNGASACLPLKP